MDTYAIVLNEPSEAAWNRIKENWESHYLVSDTLALIATESPALTLSIAESRRGRHKLRTGGVTGIVFQISYYNGWHDRTTWEWLAKHG